MHGGAPGAGAMGLIAHGMNAAGVNPPIVEIEERADGDRVVDCFVSEPGLVNGFDVGGFDGNGIGVDLGDEAK